MAVLAALPLHRSRAHYPAPMVPMPLYAQEGVDSTTGQGKGICMALQWPHSRSSSTSAGSRPTDAQGPQSDCSSPVGPL